jgi:hypothetical protein
MVEIYEQDGFLHILCCTDGSGKIYFLSLSNLCLAYLSCVLSLCYIYLFPTTTFLEDPSHKDVIALA